VKGTLYLISLCRLRLLPDHVKTRLLITRSKRKITGVTWYTQLAPSVQLFKQYLSEWKDGKVENWWQLYTDKFIKELSQEPKYSAMKYLYSLLYNGTDVAIICFCNTKHCHRYIIADVIKIAGIKVKETL